MDIEMLTKQVEFIWSAPIPFIVAVGVGYWIIWRVVKAQYSGQIAEKDARIDTLNQHIDLLKDRAEQSQVDSQIVRLVSDLSALKNKVDAIQARGTFSQQEITEVSASATTIMSDLNEVRVGVSEVFAPVWYEGIDDENSS